MSHLEDSYASIAGFLRVIRSVYRVEHSFAYIHMTQKSPTNDSYEPYAA